MLKMLCDNKNKVLDRKKALNTIWGGNNMFNRKSMDVFIFKLRKYLEKGPNIKITNIHGKGFMLQDNKSD
ncbi:winged helix-turn-helix domain-containing protein [Fulvivirgaceae bacterium BMA10]|uniref:Winged helix-turn-helix domain-containing protein n=1 Tax=Splendidivirga corallicola TaxID=3051826 RepID=A0ABT8KXE3_9BACT|nr:winged helix-turn-helix domain-containing protein [Fulvivirgaceae bacterium BMA10]